jgi:hypothetical protein
MADVFISYSQGAPEPTQALAADLTKQRYAVWFDSRMLPMEVFWKVIQEKIRAAKAVIVIWSPPSITSEWVYSEAKLAHDLKKLICVRTPDVSPADVPLPFNAYNLSLVSEREKIYESLARLGVQQAAVAPVLAKIERDASEAALAWDHIKASHDVEDFELFFGHYGEGHAFYGRLATKHRRAEGRAPTGRACSGADAEGGRRVPPHRGGHAHGVDLAYLAHRRWAASGDRLRRQDGAAVVVAGRQSRAHAAPADRAGQRGQGLCGGAGA